MSRRSTFPLFAGLAVALCCSGPLLVTAIVSSGLGAALIAAGSLPLGVVVLVGAPAAAIAWILWRRERAAAACAAPGSARKGIGP